MWKSLQPNLFVNVYILGVSDRAKTRLSRASSFDSPQHAAGTPSKKPQEEPNKSNGSANFFSTLGK